MARIARDVAELREQRDELKAELRALRAEQGAAQIPLATSQQREEPLR
ncbi:hypothetical protein [Streptosporangium roseum]